MGRIGSIVGIAGALVLSGAVPGTSHANDAKIPCLGSRELPSPDGKMIAKFTRLGRTSCGETKLEIFAEDGHLFLSADYGSNDGEQGSGAVMAQWSKDSKFLAFTLSSAALSRTGRFGLDVYQAESNKLRPLAFLAPDSVVTAPNFGFDDNDALAVTGANGVAVLVPLLR